MVSDWEAPRTNVATLAPPWWRQGWKWSGLSDSQDRLLGFDANSSKCNDCWGWPAQWWRGRQLWWTWRCRLIFCKCLQTSTVSGLLLLTSLLKLRDLLGDGLSMLRSMPELHQEVCLAEQSWKNLPNRHSKIAHELLFGNLTKCRMNCVPNLRNTLLPQLMGPNFTEHGV